MCFTNNAYVRVYLSIYTAYMAYTATFLLLSSFFALLDSDVLRSESLTFMRCGEMASFLRLSILSDQISFHFFAFHSHQNDSIEHAIQHHIAIV